MKLINISSSVHRCGQVNRFSINRLQQHLTAILHLLHRRPRDKPSIPIQNIYFNFPSAMHGMWSLINFENHNLKAESDYYYQTLKSTYSPNTQRKVLRQMPSIGPVTLTLDQKPLLEIRQARPLKKRFRWENYIFLSLSSHCMTS